MYDFDLICNWYKCCYGGLLVQTSSIWPDKYRDNELQYRLNKIEMALKESSEKKCSNQSFYSIAHEIRCLRFFQLSNIEFKSTLDCNHEAGADIRYSSNVDGRNINIECTICTYGKKPYEEQLTCAMEVVKETKSGEIATGKRESREAIDICRITQRIKDKSKSKQNIDREPFVIWIGAGELADEGMFGPNCMILLDILFGMEIPEINYNKETPQLNYSLKMGIQKNEGPENEPPENEPPEIELGFFYKEEYTDISGIIFSSGGLRDCYTVDNTFLFINPFARKEKKITAEDFAKLPIGVWDIKNGEYVFTKPRRDPCEINQR